MAIQVFNLNHKLKLIFDYYTERLVAFSKQILNDESQKVAKME
jgi:hypothetical protein